jgi:hypothetical protein
MQFGAMAAELATGALVYVPDPKEWTQNIHACSK